MRQLKFYNLFVRVFREQHNKFSTNRTKFNKIHFESYRTI